MYETFNSFPSNVKRLMYFIGFGIPAIVFLIIYTTYYFVVDDKSSYCEKIYTKEIKGKVIRKYLDPNHAVPTIEITNFHKDEISLSPSMIRDWNFFWKTIQIGDSIKKDSNSSKLRIKSPKRFYLQCD
jgi:hypothetical protein